MTSFIKFTPVLPLMRENAMSSTAFVAWWGAILSSVVFLWDVYKYRSAGPKLRFSVQTGMQSINMPEYEGRTLILAKVANRGDRPTTITNLGYLYFQKRRLLGKNIADKAAIVPNPSRAQPLPFELKPGAEWMGFAIQDAEIEKWATGGTLYMMLYHSHDEKGLRHRVVIRQTPVRQRTA